VALRASCDSDPFGIHELEWAVVEPKAHEALAERLAAAKVLAALLDNLRSASARGHAGRLAVVRAMSASDDTPTALPGPSGAPRH
jgi:hypothetical protein